MQTSFALFIGIAAGYVFLASSSQLADLAGHRLHRHLFQSNSYDPHVRPADTEDGNLTVHLGLVLTNIVKVDMKNQIMTARVWLRQEWHDTRLTWDPDDYDGISKLHIPSSDLWLPDLALYNNADGDFQITLSTKATVYHNGLVEWMPPAQYKSYCQINVEFFPFDTQTCFWKFSHWTYDGFNVDLQHICRNQGVKTGESLTIDKGIDLRRFHVNVEWDIVNVTAERKVRYYDCCPQPYPGITFYVTIRRRTLFYTVNLIIPCIAISFLTLLVFYLPADCGEKVCLSISILMALAVFFLLLNDIIPPTSLVMPMIGKYLLFTMVVVVMSIFVTVMNLSVNHRSPATHIMAPWVRRVFTEIMPKILLMHKPEAKTKKARTTSTSSLDNRNDMLGSTSHLRSLGSNRELRDEHYDRRNRHRQSVYTPYTPDILEAVKGIKFIADAMEEEDSFCEEDREWAYIAKVLDRLFLYIFSIAVFTGSVGILLHAPSLYDQREPLVSDMGSNTSCIY